MIRCIAGIRSISGGEGGERGGGGGGDRWTSGECIVETNFDIIIIKYFIGSGNSLEMHASAEYKTEEK